jgi:hypothetical protein
MQNVGTEQFNYDSFKQAYDANPLTQGLVKKFDQNGVELNSKRAKIDTAPSDAEDGGATVSQMAKRATTAARG